MTAFQLDSALEIAHLDSALLIMMRAALLALPFAADAVKEFVAMVPAAADAHETKPTVEWVQLDYAADVSDANDVRMAVVNDTDGSNEIGAWRHLDLSVGGGSGAMVLTLGGSVRSPVEGTVS